MKSLLVRLHLRTLLVSLAVMGAMFLTACGDDEEACADVDCEFGVCDSSSGQCINRDYCETDEGCLPGYGCTLDHACQPLSECSADTDCEAGVCQEGVCVNASSCEADTDCVERTYCGPNNTCVPDPCNDVSCQRGVCARGTDKCVSAPTCTEETEQFDCIAGEKCAEGACQPADTFCDNITCERGVCDFAAGGCTNAPNCEGDSANCAEGYFCNDQNTCAVDLCERDQIDCGDNGVCVPSVGECQNANSCASNDDCLSDHQCVEGTCRLLSVACGDSTGDGGCPGNQLCEYDEGTLTASCVEPDQCLTSLDCTGDRQCAGRECIDPVSCTDDYFEPNDTDAEATVFTDVAENGLLEASLCSGDTDLFSFATADLSAAQRGTMVVELRVAQRDIGLGQVDVRLLKDGAEQGSASTGALSAEGTARIEMPFSVADGGDYTVEVSAGDDLAGPGVAYDLSVNILSDETLAACQNAIPMVINQRLSGSTDESASNQLGSSCTSAANPSSEVVYALEVDQPQEVTFTLTPELSSTDLSMSLRSQCGDLATEDACVESAGAGEQEVLTAVLGTGTHYLVVQAPEGASGGAFQLLVSAINTFCSPQDNFCSDAQTSNICATGGGRFVTQSCDAGCNPTTGRCFPPAGDVCFDAAVVDGDFLETVNLLQLANDYEAPQGGCVEGDTTESNGPDQTYQVEVPAQTAVTARVSFANEVNGSLYFVEDCADAAGTCVAGANANDEDTPSQEELSFANDTDNPRTLYLVIDTAAGQPFSTAEVDITFDAIVCTPAATRCDPADSSIVQACNEFGTEFVEQTVCGSALGCDSGACVAESCAGAYDATADATQAGGATYSYDWDVWANDLGGSGCNMSSSDTDSQDLVFAVTLQADEVLRASLFSSDSSPDADPAMAIMPACGDINDTCYDGYDTGGDPILLSYQATATETVYVIVESDDAAASGEAFDLHLEIAPACDPATFSPTCQSGNVDYCTTLGSASSVQTFQCDPAGGCNNGACDTANADFCFDALDISTDARQPNGTSITLDWSTFGGELGATDTCNLTASELAGQDAYYEIAMQAGEVLTASLDNGSSFDDPALILTGDCTGPNDACLASDDSTSSASISYLAETAETVYLIADSDTAGSTGTFTLDVTLSAADCTPSTYTPTCTSGDVQYCDSLGGFDTYACDATGGCTNGMCDVRTSDYCFDSENITVAASATGGTTISGTWGDFTNDWETYNCGISASNSDGYDGVYTVELLAGQTLDASATSSGFVWPAVAVVTDCTAATSSCQVGDGGTSSPSISYTASVDETVYLVLDEDAFADPSDTFDLSVEITSAAP